MKKILIIILIFSCTKIININFRNKDIDKDLIIAKKNNRLNKVI